MPEQTLDENKQQATAVTTHKKEKDSIAFRFEINAVSASFDMLFMWVLFYISKMREAHGGKNLSGMIRSGLPQLTAELTYGKPFIPTLVRHLSAAKGLDRLRLIQQLYSGAPTFLFTAYIWLIWGEIIADEVAEHYGFNKLASTFFASLTGALLATPGEHQLIKGRSLTKMFQRGLWYSLKETRGWLPTIGREFIFAAVVITGMQKEVAKLIAQHCFDENLIDPESGKEIDPSFEAKTIALILFSPTLYLTQPFARVAALMQEKNLTLRQAIKTLSQQGNNHLAALNKELNKLPDNVASKVYAFIRRFIARRLVAYFPGGYLRAVSLIGTNLIFTAVGAFGRDYLIELNKRIKEKYQTLKDFMDEHPKIKAATLVTVFTPLVYKASPLPAVRQQMKKSNTNFKTAVRQLNQNSKAAARQLPASSSTTQVLRAAMKPFYPKGGVRSAVPLVAATAALAASHPKVQRQAGNAVTAIEKYGRYFANRILPQQNSVLTSSAIKRWELNPHKCFASDPLYASKLGIPTIFTQGQTTFRR
jgi:hypothetical protein